MNILITGYTGFIGSNLLPALLNNKKYNFLLIAKNKKKKIKKNNIEYIHANLKNIEKFEKKIINFNPRIIINLAWEGIPNFSKEYCKKNYQNSIKLAKICLKIKNCKKFIGFGSCLEYKKKIGSCKENSYLDRSINFSFYKNKINEDIKKLFIKTDIKFIWLRIFYIYGKNQRKNSLIPTIINSIKNDKKFEFKNPYDSNDYINIDDLINIIKISIKKNIPSGEYNVGSGKTYQNIYILDLIKSLISGNNKYLTNIHSYKLSKNCKNNFYADMNKTLKIFKFKPKIDIKKGIKLLINEK